MVVNRDCLGHNFYIYEWILKCVRTVVLLEVQVPIETFVQVS